MFYKDKTVLITGGSGFVGTNLIEELLKQGARIRVTLHNRPMNIKDEQIDTVFANLYRIEDCLTAVKGVDYVCHAGGGAIGAAVTAGNPMSAIAANMITTIQVLQAAWIEGVERFLLLSSHTTYPNAEYPIKEEEMWSGPTDSSYFGYGWMRRYLERLVEFVVSRSDMKIALVRPTAAYGRWDNFNPATSHVIPALIRRALEKEDPYVVWGSGDVVRDFIHVSDMVRGGLLALEKYATCDPVNIGCGKAVTIGEIVELILKVTGHEKARVEYDTSKPTTIPYRMVDTSKAKKVLGFEPSLSLEEGLRDTVEWYKEVGSKIKND